MKKRSLLIVVALLCMASLMAAMAFSSAIVDNGMTFAVVATNAAKVGIIENEDHSGVAKIVDDRMKLDFGPGMQPGSTYFYDDLFFIKNNTDKPIYVGLRFNSCYAGKPDAITNFPVGLHTITASKNLYEPVNDYGSTYNNVMLLGGPEFRSGAYEGRLVELQPEEEISVDFNYIINGAQDLLNRNNISLQVLAYDSPNGK